MKITRIEAFRVCVPVRPGTVHSPEFEDSCHQFNWQGRFFAEMPKFVYRVQTDEGITGIGESYREVSDGAVKNNIRALLGLDVMKVNLRALPIPFGREYDGFEVAVYDLVGKKFGVPVYQLLGGAYRDRVLMSYWTGRRTPQDVARIARQAQDAGFTSLKMKCALEDPHVERVEAIRASCGPGFGIVLDPNQRFEHPSSAMRLAKSLETYKIDCFEDPVPHWNLDWYRLLREKTSIPIALHVHAPYGQKIEEMIQAIKLEAVDYFNLGAGLAHFVRMAEVADAAGIPVWHGSEVDLGILDAASLHACAAVRNCTLPSDIVGTLVREDDLIVEELEFCAGFAHVPEGPGLGVNLDEAALERYTIEKWI
jgi:muconate cycloisomerase